MDSALEVGFAIDEDNPEDLQPRAPVVTIMGHVDHGKTSLLDAIRNTRVTAGEAGGITQHIGAYQVEHKGNKITFIDTPGHAAFTDMRERGANITDIVILVVAADDGVKQQTADSIMCARQAGVPIVVAINKCDLETADPSRVKSDLTAYDVLTEDLGGDVLLSEISAKEGKNLDDLLDKVMLQAEIQDLKANPDREAQGVVVEARVERGLGTVATTLVQKGTLRVGDTFFAGETFGRVRALIGVDGKTRYDEAPPSTPISVVGFDGVPMAGDVLVVVENEQVARDLAESRQRIAREKESQSYQAGLMNSVAAQFGGSVNKERREMCVVVKADVQGSAEALTRALSELKLENDEAIVTVKVLVSEAGEVSKSDVAIASVTPDTTILAFNVAASFAAMEDARSFGIPIEYYNIVYDAIESVESRMQEVLSPTPDGDYTGKAVVQEVFNIGGTGNIAGSKCIDGFLRKGGNVRVMRGDKILVEGKIRSLRNFKVRSLELCMFNFTLCVAMCSCPGLLFRRKSRALRKETSVVLV
jgi:translation initiation factor IF-2